VSTLSKSLLLFGLNWLDAQLTILWVRLDIATEGNGIMARILELGEGTFLFTKLAIGAFAAYVLYRCAHLAIARREVLAKGLCRLERDPLKPCENQAIANRPEVQRRTEHHEAMPNDVVKVQLLPHVENDSCRVCDPAGQEQS